MKKILVFALTAIIFVSSCNITAFSAVGAEIVSDNMTYFKSGDKTQGDIIAMLDDYKNSKYTKSQLCDKLSSQLMHADIFIDGADSLEDIYGIQFSVKLNGNAVLAYITSDLQNNDKPGSSPWFAELKAKDTDYQNAQVLMYGTKPISAEVNKKLNQTSDKRYKVATLYFAVASDSDKDISISYSTQDIAARDNNGKVISIADRFKKSTSFSVKYSSERKIYCNMLGTQIRVGGRQGLRFGTKVVKDDYFNKCSDVSYGTLIVPTSLLGGKKLNLDYKGDVYNCAAKIYEEDKDYLIFTGEITGFPDDGKYDDTNFTAVGYIKYKEPDSKKYTTIYTDEIVRNVNMVKTEIKNGDR